MLSSACEALSDSVAEWFDACYQTGFLLSDEEALNQLSAAPHELRTYISSDNFFYISGMNAHRHFASMFSPSGSPVTQSDIDETNFELSPQRLYAWLRGRCVNVG